jgi:AraC-like DNA-binding protein
VGEYIRRLRLDYAMQELAQSAKAIAEVALEVGFYDQSHFTHAFKLHTGMTPAQFRSAVQTGKSHTKKRRFSKTSSDKSAILE